MKVVLKIACGLALGLTIAPPIMAVSGSMPENLVKPLMLAGTILWFAAATPLTRTQEAPGQSHD